MRNNLTKWAKNFHLFQGLIVNKNRTLENSKRFVIDFIEIPKINSSDKSRLEMINVKPSTQSEAILTSHNIFSLKDLSSFPFIRSDDEGCHINRNYIIVKREQYEILLNRIRIRMEI